VLTRTVEFEIAPGEIVRVEGLPRDRRRGSELAITLPDGRSVVAEGRRPAEEGWVVALADGSDFSGGLNLGEGLALLMGWRGPGVEDEPEWVSRFLAAIA
jgi:hypothetical protein